MILYMHTVFLIISSPNPLPTSSSSFQYFLQLLCDFFKQVFFKNFYLCVYVAFVNVCHMYASTHRSQKRVSGLLKLELQMVLIFMWVLDSGPLEEQQILINHRPTSLAPSCCHFKNYFQQACLSWQADAVACRTPCRYAIDNFSPSVACLVPSSTVKVSRQGGCFQGSSILLSVFQTVLCLQQLSTCAEQTSNSNTCVIFMGVPLGLPDQWLRERCPMPGTERCF